MQIAVICKTKTNISEICKASPPPFFSRIFATVYVLQYSSFWNHKTKAMASKLQVTPTKLQVTPTKLQVTGSKLTSLTAETNKFQLTNMLFITF